MHVRPATLRDITAVALCETRAFAAFVSGHADQTVARHDLASQLADGAIHVIGDGADVFGYIAMWPTAGHLFIETLAVLPERQGQGLASRLLAFAEREAARLRLPSVRLFTKETMTGNLAFYRRRGYREVGRCDEDGFARVFYVKDVAARAADALRAV